METTYSGTTASRARRSDVSSTGFIISAAACALLLILLIPAFSWIRVVNQEALYEVMGLKKSAVAAVEGLGSDFSVFRFLSFVQESKAGILGLWSFILLMLAVSAAVFHLWSVIQFLRRNSLAGGKGLLSLYKSMHAGQLFSFLLGVGTVGLVIFANRHYGMTGFQARFPAWVSAIAAAAGYFAGKKSQMAELKLQKDHGFVEEVRRNWILFVFLIPCFVFFMINNYLPMVGIYFSFTQFNFRDGLFASPFVGLKNFQFLFRSEILHLTWNTIAYNVVFIVVGNVLQIFFAILVSQVHHGALKKTSQTMIFMPYFVSYVILRVLVFNVLEYDVGLINNARVAMGLDRLDFYNTPGYWPWIITLFYLWKNIGYGMVVYLATITGISSDYYEAAEIDGANVFQQIRYITIPQLKPTFIILLLYALGGIMKGQFELFYQLVGNNGTLFSTTDIFDTYVYRIAMTQPLSIGMGTAAGLFQSLFGFVVIMVTNFLIKRKNPEYALF